MVKKLQPWYCASALFTYRYLQSGFTTAIPTGKVCDVDGAADADIQTLPLSSDNRMTFV